MRTTARRPMHPTCLAPTARRPRASQLEMTTTIFRAWRRGPSTACSRRCPPRSFNHDEVRFHEGQPSRARVSRPPYETIIPTREARRHAGRYERRVSIAPTGATNGLARDQGHRRLAERRRRGGVPVVSPPVSACASGGIVLINVHYNQRVPTTTSSPRREINFYTVPAESG